MESLLVKGGALARAFDPRDMIDDDIRAEAKDRVARE